LGPSNRPAADSATTIIVVEPPVQVDLSGVQETLLGNLGRRAAAARISAFEDPMAIELVDRLDSDFADAARGVRSHAARVATFDRAVRRFLGRYPAGTVAALGEGLESEVLLVVLW
jgi:O-methyltransferase involved in polyketide biosynthesis